MTLKNQVVSLELAKRLKELGVKQESLFYWCDGKTDVGHKTLLVMGTQGLCEIDGKIRARGFSWNELPEKVESSAFTVAELGEMLPDGCKDWRYKDMWIGDFGGGIRKTVDTLKLDSSATEADARGGMLIYLLENSLLPCPSSK